MDNILLRPLPLTTASVGMLRLAGGPVAFAELELLRRGHPPQLVPNDAVDMGRLAPFCALRDPILGIAMDRPLLMAVLNVTPDSFSDGGTDADMDEAVARGMALAAAGADFIDIGGESTRPGADQVSIGQEQDRVLPVIEGLRAAGLRVPISIDTRNAATARAAMAAGAGLFNDISALTHDPDSLATAAELRMPVCLMHAQGDPKTMQADPRYDDVVLDVHDWLGARVEACVAAGIPKSRIIVDPGIGFGKTLAHNLRLISHLSVFHGLGCAVMLGASRKRFIGTLTGVEHAAERGAGSVGAAIAGAAQGAQILRVHDVAMTRQALLIWSAASGMWEPET
ncbi:MAG: dihydropteroate synthase [Pseudomonadota bacterium]